jgi:hypothetical protein
MKIKLFLLMVFINWIFIACTIEKESNYKLENKHAEIEIRDDLNGLLSFKTKDGIDFISEKSTSLYAINFGNNYDNVNALTSADADTREIRKEGDNIYLSYWHDNGKLKVNCNLSTHENDSLFYWSISVENLTSDTISSIKYPVIKCKSEIGDSLSQDAVAYPHNEGVLLTGLNGNQKVIERYPGVLSSQMMYNFDSEAGLYYAAHDGTGYPKNLSLHSDSSGLRMFQEYVLPIKSSKTIEMPYQVVTGISGGRWESGAAIYRSWSDRQSWTKKSFGTENRAAWLKTPKLFINTNFGSKDLSVRDAFNLINDYKDFFQCQVVTAVFGWEKHGTWIGPDYFPPVPSEFFYEKLTELLDKQNDHLHFYTSGFRWGVRKPVSESQNTPRIYTSYNGYEDFMKNGVEYSAMHYTDSIKMQKPRWADNYFMCTGTEGARNILDSCFQRIYNMGVSGVDLDQNLGGEVEDCFNPHHNHPPGAGLWQTESMDSFLSTIQKKNAARGDKFFLGVEEVCERYIRHFDIYHGRAFTATRWPVMGPGAVSIPLYIYLNHQHQPGYAGWIDTGFSPGGIIRVGLGRAFIFGMLPGIRVKSSPLIKDDPSPEIMMLKGYIELLEKFPGFLVNGRMLGEMEILGAMPFDCEAGRGETLPISWKSVQGICWMSPEDSSELAYALCNLSGDKQTIKFQIHESNDGIYSKNGYSNGLELIEEFISSSGRIVEITIQPWEMAVIHKVR